MTNFDIYFPLFENMLYGKLNPMLEENADGHDYSVRISEMICYDQQDTGAYYINFHKPFNLKTRYYEQLLSGELNAYVADLQQTITTENNTNIRAYLRDQLLDKHLTYCLKKLGNKIRQEGLWLAGLQNPDNNTDCRSDIYVFHFLKICIAKAYLEIQDLLSDVVSFRQTEEWLYSTHVGEPLPVQNWIKKRKTGKPAIKQQNADATQLPENDFKPENYYTGVQVRELLGFSEATLNRRVKDPGFPKPIKKGRDNYFLKKDIDPLKKNQ